MARTRRREIESAALAALMPVVALVPVWALAITVVWWPVTLVTGVGWWWFAGGYLALGLLLYWRPVQRVVLTRLLGARRPHPTEAYKLEPAWRQVAQATGIAPGRFVVTVLDDDALNAFACGGHLVVVTSYAVAELPGDELSGVLAHELSHHLGSHTVALTAGQWLGLPAVALARIGFFLRSVATAATDAFARGSTLFTVIGRSIGLVLNAVSWVFLAGLLASNVVANIVGRSAEFQADRRVVEMGFGRELAGALRHVVRDGTSDRALTWRERIWQTHPPARTRVARIDAQLRAARRRPV